MHFVTGCVFRTVYSQLFLTQVLLGHTVSAVFQLKFVLKIDVCLVFPPVNEHRAVRCCVQNEKVFISNPSAAAAGQQALTD